jgi:hypothetical protein
MKNPIVSLPSDRRVVRARALQGRSCGSRPGSDRSSGRPSFSRDAGLRRLRAFERARDSEHSTPADPVICSALGRPIGPHYFSLR